MVKIITKKQLNLFEVFREDVFAKYTYNDFKEKLNEKSNSFLTSSLKKFEELNLIQIEKINNSKIYYLNLENDLVFNYIEIINQDFYKTKIIEKTINLLKEELNKNLYSYSILIFGSYAIKKEKKNSDLDIAIYIEDEKKRKNIEKVFKTIKIKSPIDVDLHVISKEEFLKMLKVEYSNLGKLIFQKHKCIYNTNLFYKILKEGYLNGYRIQNLFREK